MIRPVLVLALLSLLAPRTARAEAHRLDLLVSDGDAGANAVQLRVGVQHAFVAELGYTHAVSLAGHALYLDAEVALPWAELDAEDYRVRAGLTAAVVASGPWRVFARIAPTLRGTHNEMGRFLGVGADGSLRGGYFGARWSVALEAGADAALVTHVTHSDRYRAIVYGGARDGSYFVPGGLWRVGLQAGVAVGQGDLGVQLGRLYTSDFEPAVLPLYALAGYAHRW